jgi:putative transposase
MARRHRVVIPGWVHHITQRGNHRQPVFYSDHDRVVYMRLVEKYFRIYGIDLLGHSLMTNHVHFTAIPEEELSFSLGIGQLQHDFACWQNMQCGTSGHLWQGRFYSCPVEKDRVGQVLRYIELNPVRAGMVENPWDWKWSSAKAHITGQDPTGLLNMNLWQDIFKTVDWREFLGSTADEEAVRAQIRRTTMQGYFLGSEATARRLELELGIQLLPKKRGRKRLT